MFGQSEWSNSTEPNTIFYNAKVSNQSTTKVDNLIYTDNRASPVLTNFKNCVNVPACSGK